MREPQSQPDYWGFQMGHLSGNLETIWHLGQIAIQNTGTAWHGFNTQLETRQSSGRSLAAHFHILLFIHYFSLTSYYHKLFINYFLLTFLYCLPFIHYLDITLNGVAPLVTHPPRWYYTTEAKSTHLRFTSLYHQNFWNIHGFQNVVRYEGWPFST